MSKPFTDENLRVSKELLAITKGLDVIAVNYTTVEGLIARMEAAEDIIETHEVKYCCDLYKAWLKSAGKICL